MFAPPVLQSVDERPAAAYHNFKLGLNIWYSIMDDWMCTIQIAVNFLHADKHKAQRSSVYKTCYLLYSAFCFQLLFAQKPLINIDVVQIKQYRTPPTWEMCVLWPLIVIM